MSYISINSTIGNDHKELLRGRRRSRWRERKSQGENETGVMIVMQNSYSWLTVLLQYIYICRYVGCRGDGCIYIYTLYAIARRWVCGSKKPSEGFLSVIVDRPHFVWCCRCYHLQNKSITKYTLCCIYDHTQTYIYMYILPPWNLQSYSVGANRCNLPALTVLIRQKHISQ